MNGNENSIGHNVLNENQLGGYPLVNFSQR